MSIHSQLVKEESEKKVERYLQLCGVARLSAPRDDGG
jgi:hypothetical protein